MPARSFTTALAAAALLTPLALDRSSAQEGPSPSPITIGETLTVRSRTLGEAREAMVYLPAGHRQGDARYPVLYVLDGESAFLHTAAAAEFLAGFGLMPEAIVVGVRNTDRGRDFTPPLARTDAPPPGMGAHGGADAFLSFLADELAPAVEARYRTEPMRVLVGHSLGGLLAAHAMVSRPALFRGYVTLEPSLWWDGRALPDTVIAFFRAHPGHAGRLAAVEGSSAEGWRPDWPRLRPLVPRDFRWSAVDLAGESHETLGYRGVYEGLKALFADYAPEHRRDESRATPEALDQQYARLSREYGYAVRIPESALLEAAARQAGYRRHARAVRLLERASALYPASAAVRERLAQARAALASAGADTAGLPPVVAALRPVGAAEAAPFVGVWEGTERVEPGEPLSVVVTLQLAGDTLAGGTVAGGAGMGGGDFRVSHDGHSVHGDTLRWYRINRGGGVYVYTAVLRGPDTLEGSMELRDGPPPPPGFTPPTVTFTLRRRAGTSP